MEHRSGLWLRAVSASRPAKREFEPRVGRLFAMGLICNAMRTGTGPSEQPAEKAGHQREVRAFGASPRCTAVREKRPNSWASAAGPAVGETVRTGHVGGARGAVVKPSPVDFLMDYKPHGLRWMLPGESRACCGGLHCCTVGSRCAGTILPGLMGRDRLSKAKGPLAGSGPEPFMNYGWAQ